MDKRDTNDTKKPENLKNTKDDEKAITVRSKQECSSVIEKKQSIRKKILLEVTIVSAEGSYRVDGNTFAFEIKLCDEDEEPPKLEEFYHRALRGLKFSPDELKVTYSAYYDHLFKCRAYAFMDEPIVLPLSKPLPPQSSNQNNNNQNNNKGNNGNGNNGNNNDDENGGNKNNNNGNNGDGLSKKQRKALNQQNNGGGGTRNSAQRDPPDGALYYIRAQVCGLPQLGALFFTTRHLLGNAYVKLVIDLRPLISDQPIPIQQNVNYIERSAVFMWDPRHLYMEMPPGGDCKDCHTVSGGRNNHKPDFTEERPILELLLSSMIRRISGKLPSVRLRLTKVLKYYGTVKGFKLNCYLPTLMVPDQSGDWRTYALLSKIGPGDKFSIHVTRHAHTTKRK
ncbi:hypothetical protein DdX_20522 [Ditylenchus destructor]|uniref:Uncharacterized protein n=1 Tax=Ditylenchus destructor TaxID=166010 RepID=A0AAD4ML75_9BILA|nr:hypothetical protein DdX_20522 [Ditylenchus destructor]